MNQPAVMALGVIETGATVAMRVNHQLVDGSVLMKGSEFLIHSVIHGNNGDETMVRLATRLKPHEIHATSVPVSAVTFVAAPEDFDEDDIDGYDEGDYEDDDMDGFSHIPIKRVRFSQMIEEIRHAKGVGDLDSDEPGTAARWNAGKVKLHLVPLTLIADIARVFEHGETKYKSWNWAKGGMYSDLYDCVLRHLNTFFYGLEHQDEETGLHPLDHALASLLILKHAVNTYPDGDDRPVHFSEPDNE